MNVQRLILAAGLLTALPMFSAFAFAQPSAERFFGMLDQNENGTVDPDEWDRLPPLRDFVESRGQSLDRPVSYDEFAQIQEAFGEEMRARRDAERAASESPRDADRPPPAPPSSPATAVVAAVPGTGKWTRPRPPVTYALPEEFKARDTNGDGQIGLYEWPRSDIAGFRKLDYDRDGFLTPVELLKSLGRLATTTVVAQPAPTTVATLSPGTPNSGPPVPGRPGFAPPGSPTPGGPMAFSDPTAARADFSFNQLDRNKDGSINPDEFRRSRMVRPQFEQAGIDMSQSMPRAQFLEHFTRLNTPK